MGTLQGSTRALADRECRTQVSLLGVVRAERDGCCIVLRGTQPRLVFVYLSIHRNRSIPADEIAEMLWPHARSGHWEGAIRGVISKIRAFLHELGPSAPTIDNVGHTYRFAIGTDTALDIGRAELELAAAADHLAAERWQAAAVAASATAALLAETLLPALDKMWIDRRRSELLAKRCRANRIAAVAQTKCGRHDEAILLAESAVADDVFDEQNHRALMDAHLAAGNRGAALRAYGQCRRTLAEQLGVSPSDETELLYLRILAAANLGNGRPAGRIRRIVSTGADRPFVGREVELKAIVTAWDLAQLSGCQIVLVRGEAGIGKTRLALEAIRSLEAVNVLYGRCSADQVTLFEPFVEAVGRYADRLDDFELAEVFQGFGSELSSVVPSIAARLEGDSGERTGYRLTLFESLRAALARVSAKGPTVLALDDLHLAGPSSLLLLQHTLRVLDRARLLVLISYRDDYPPSAKFADAIGEIHRLAGCHATRLLGLDAAEIGELLRATSVPSPAEFGKVLHERTGGNCFYLTQLLSATSDDPAGFDPFGIPDTVSEVVRYRVAGLSVPARRLLAMAAVIGVSVPRWLLEDSMSGDSAGMDAVDELVERCFLLERDSGAYGFAHAIVRDAIYDQLPGGRRRRLHREVVRSLLNVGRENPRNAAILAYHLEQADDPGTAAHQFDAGVPALSMTV